MSRSLEKSTEAGRNTVPRSQPTKKQIIVCCDGTGQRSSPPVSNVSRIFDCIEKSHDREKLYQPGIGTGKWNPFGLLQQATGAGQLDVSLY